MTDRSGEFAAVLSALARSRFLWPWKPATTDESHEKNRLGINNNNITTGYLWQQTTSSEVFCKESVTKEMDIERGNELVGYVIFAILTNWSFVWCGGTQVFHGLGWVLCCVPRDGNILVGYLGRRGVMTKESEREGRRLLRCQGWVEIDALLKTSTPFLA